MLGLWIACASHVGDRWTGGLGAVKKQALAWLVGVGLALGSAAGVYAQGGFYGGVSMRDNGAEASGVNLTPQPSAQALIWSRFATPTPEESAQRSLVYGGYRWKNDVVSGARLNFVSGMSLRKLWRIRFAGRGFDVA